MSKESNADKNVLKDFDFINMDQLIRKNEQALSAFATFEEAKENATFLQPKVMDFFFNDFAAKVIKFGCSDIVAHNKLAEIINKAEEQVAGADKSEKTGIAMAHVESVVRPWAEKLAESMGVKVVDTDVEGNRINKDGSPYHETQEVSKEAHSSPERTQVSRLQEKENSVGGAVFSR